MLLNISYNMQKPKGRKKSPRKKPKKAKPKPVFRKAQEESSKGNELAVIEDKLLGSGAWLP